jgi:hypothetical protein
LRRRSGRFSKAEVRQRVEPLTSNLALKVTAVALAFLLWTVVKADNRVLIESVPIAVVTHDANWVPLGAPNPASVDVVFSGPVRELFRVAVSRPTILLPVDSVADPTQTQILRNGYVQYEAAVQNTRAEEFRPSTVEVSFERMATRLIPIAVGVSGMPVPGFELAGPPMLYPGAVQASGGLSRFAALDSIRLPVIDVSGLSVTDTFEVAIDTAGLGVMVAPREVHVVVPIRAVRPASAGTSPPRTGG